MSFIRSKFDSLQQHRAAKAVKRLAAVVVVAALAAPAHATTPNSGGGGLPWERPLETILASIQGPIARFAIITAIIVTGIGMAFGEHGSGFKKLMGVVFGGAIIVGVISFVSTLFGATF